MPQEEEDKQKELAAKRKLVTSLRRFLNHVKEEKEQKTQEENQ